MGRGLGSGVRVGVRRPPINLVKVVRVDPTDPAHILVVVEVSWEHLCRTPLDIAHLDVLPARRPANLWMALVDHRPGLDNQRGLHRRLGQQACLAWVRVALRMHASGCVRVMGEG